MGERPRRGAWLAATAAIAAIAAVFALTHESRRDDAPAAVASSAPAVEPERAVANAVASRPTREAATIAEERAPDREAAPEADAAPRELTVAERTGIRGRAVDAESGLPIARFKVHARLVQESDDDREAFAELARRKWKKSPKGAFTIRELAPGRYRVVASADDYVDASSEPVDVSEGVLAPDVLVKFARAAVLRGKVIDAATGEPVLGASLQAIDEPRPAFLRPSLDGSTGESGTFELRKVRPRTVRVEATHKRYMSGASEPVVAVAGAPRDLPTIALRRGGVIEGIALGESGETVPGARVSASLQSSTPPSFHDRYRSVAADGSGAFRIEGLCAGTWEVTASKTTFASGGTRTTQQRRGVVEVAEGETARVAFDPPARGGCTLRGTVTRGGSPLAGALVSVAMNGEYSRENARVRYQSMMTGPDGAFAFEHLPSGDATLRVSGGLEGTGSQSRSVSIPDVAESVVDVALPIGGAIEGRIVSAGDGRPVVGIAVNASVRTRTGEDASASASTKTDEGGRYAMTALSPGRYRVRVGRMGFGPASDAKAASAGFAPATTEVDVADGGIVTASFSLARGAIAVVEVRAADGAPMPRVMVNLMPWIEEPSAEPFELPRTASTDENGIARFGGLAGGRWIAAASPPDAPLVRSGPVDVAAAADVSVRLDVPRSVPIEVRAIDADGKDVDITSVSLTTEGSRYSSFARPSSGGSPRVFGATGHRCTIHVASKERKLSGSVEIDIGDDPPPEIVVKLAPMKPR
ncbi:MAG TPA: carboxypeptidase regulatory-like domain-containing protein [Planctomycetota bacterium]|nr:carboxypeptidase regulatory-like domain-containing protein [Planctomycetota bacterium]